MSERDPIQRAADGATLTLDAYKGGQLDALREMLTEFESLADDLRRRIRDLESRRNDGLFESSQGELSAADADE
jgi:hypothetical protein